MSASRYSMWVRVGKDKEWLLYAVSDLFNSILNHVNLFNPDPNEEVRVTDATQSNRVVLRIRKRPN